MLLRTMESVQPATRFRVLGTLEARVGRRPVSLDGPRTRSVLALLLLRANTVCSTDRLICDLWDGSPPSSARAQVQNHVSGLRHALRAAGARDPFSALITRPPGYLLRVREEGLDLERFRRALAEGRWLRASGDAEAASGAFRRALAYWRGPALCDVPLPCVRDFAAHLDELRIDALEDWAEAALCVGDCAEVVAEVSDVVLRHPLRERLRASLMRALAAGGRVAEALEVYHAGRKVLVGELGIEPGAELREAQRAVLSCTAPSRPPARARTNAAGTQGSNRR